MLEREKIENVPQDVLELAALLRAKIVELRASAEDHAEAAYTDGYEQALAHVTQLLDQVVAA